MSRVELVDWASDEEGSIFEHEVEPIQDAVAQTLRPIIFKSVLASVIGREYTRLDSSCQVSSTTVIQHFGRRGQHRIAAFHLFISSHSFLETLWYASRLQISG